MNRLTITLTPAQKSALTTAYQNLSQFVDSPRGKQAIEILRRVSPARRDAILAWYPRLAALVELGRKLRIDP